MWMINELKRDAINIGGCLAGSIILMYLTIGKFDTNFLRHVIRMLIAVMSVGGVMVMQNSIGKNTNNMFKFLAICYRYMGIIAVIILMTRNRYGTHLNEQYIKVRVIMDFFEMTAIVLSYRYLKREFSQTKAHYIAILFFISTVYSILKPFLSQYTMSNLISLACAIEIIVIVLIIGLFYLNYYLMGQFDKRIIFRMYLFLGFKGLYHITTILYMYSDSYISYMALIFFRFIYTYHLLATISCERIRVPWQELLQKVKITNEKLNDNKKDRHNIINLSHELKTPIHVIQSAVDILKLDLKKDSEDELISALKAIKRSCYQSTKLITNIIDNNKLDEGCIHPRDKDCNLIVLLDNVIEALAEYNPKWHIWFSPEQEEVYVRLDQDLIQRSILNLIALLIRYQKQNAPITIHLEFLKQQVVVKITSKSTILPLEYTHEETKHYNKDNIDELASFEFVKKVFNLYDTSLYLISNKQQGTTIYMHLNLSTACCSENIQAVNYEENVSTLVSKIRVQYADL